MFEGTSLPFVSPIAKLVRFFCKSRDQWKAKCKIAKGENKSLKYRLAKMTENRNRWKAEAKALRQKLSEETSGRPSRTKSDAPEHSRRRRRGVPSGLLGAR